MEQEPKTKILAKLHAIMSEIGFIGKDKENKFHGYKYASEQAIKEAIHPLLVKHKVLFTLAVNEHKIDKLTVTVTKGEEKKSQTESIFTSIRMAYRFYDVDSGEFINGSFWGDGQDKGDKGLYKAITGGLKYILTSTFLIPTGDDPETAENAPRSVANAKRPSYTTPTPKASVIAPQQATDENEPPFIGDEHAKVPLPYKPVCPKCGAATVISPRTGKPYCGMKCWLNK